MKLPEKVPEKGFYYHYKHDPSGPVNNYAYKVVGVGFHTEDVPDRHSNDAFFVNYLPLYESAAVYQASQKFGMVCTDERPLEMWMGNVTKEGKTFPRFTKITDPAALVELELIEKKMYDQYS